MGEFFVKPLNEGSKSKIYFESLFPKDGTIVGLCSRIVCLPILVPTRKLVETNEASIKGLEAGLARSGRRLSSCGLKRDWVST